MRWLLELLDRCYKNIYQVSLVILSVMLFIFFTSLSAQYIGDELSKKILNEKGITISVIFDEKNSLESKHKSKEFSNFIKKLKDNDNFSNTKIRLKKQKINDKNIMLGNFDIIISNNDEFMEKMAHNGLFASLDRELFDANVIPYVEFSKYDEYAKVNTIYGVPILIAFSSEVSNFDRSQIIRTFNVLNNMVFYKTYIEDRTNLRTNK